MTVVVGYASTPEGRAALQRSVQEARRCSGKLVVIPLERAVSDSQVRKSVAEDLAHTGVTAEIRVTADHGDPVEQILGEAEKQAAELIVIGLRRRSPVGKLILGSNAQRILLEAPCPVVTVKSDT
jgi:nucleotide-binding universal stress UspA family protein